MNAQVKTFEAGREECFAAARTMGPLGVAILVGLANSRDFKNYDKAQIASLESFEEAERHLRGMLANQPALDANSTGAQIRLDLMSRPTPRELVGETFVELINDSEKLFIEEGLEPDTNQDNDVRMMRDTILWWHPDYNQQQASLDACAICNVPTDYAMTLPDQE